MWKKIAVAGATAAIIAGAGTAAVAATGSSSPTPSASGSSSAAPGQSGATGKHDGKGRHGKAGEFGRAALHGTWVTKDAKTGQFVTHDEIRGSVTAVSATSITVKAADNVSQTYVVNSSTKVHVQGQAKGTTGSISSVKTGNTVVVLGTGTSTLTATHVLAGVK